MVEFNSDDLKYLSEFEKLTNIIATDYVLTPYSIIYLVSKPDLGKAIGKKGSNIERLNRFFKRRVVVIANSSDLEEFVRNFFSNVEILSVETREAMGDKAVFLTVAEKDRGIAIGKEGERIKAAKDFLKKKFNATISVHTRRAVI